MYADRNLSRGCAGSFVAERKVDDCVVKVAFLRRFCVEINGADDLNFKCRLVAGRFRGIFIYGSCFLNDFMLIVYI